MSILSVWLEKLRLELEITGRTWRNGLIYNVEFSLLKLKSCYLGLLITLVILFFLLIFYYFNSILLFGSLFRRWLSWQGFLNFLRS